MLIDNLLVTQFEVRDTQQIKKMAEFVQKGGFFHKCFNLIWISKFPDGKHYIHDGHHRVISISMGGRQELREDEYYIIEWDSYSPYLTFNKELGVYTPFDPRTELRVADFWSFKQYVMSLPEEEQENYILANKNKYCKERDNIHTVHDLCQKILS